MDRHDPCRRDLLSQSARDRQSLGVESQRLAQGEGLGDRLLGRLDEIVERLVATSSAFEKWWASIS